VLRLLAIQTHTWCGQVTQIRTNKHKHKQNKHHTRLTTTHAQLPLHRLRKNNKDKPTMRRMQTNQRKETSNPPHPIHTHLPPHRQTHTRNINTLHNLRTTSNTQRSHPSRPHRHRKPTITTTPCPPHLQPAKKTTKNMKNHTHPHPPDFSCKYTPSRTHPNLFVCDRETYASLTHWFL
jgi:hypothetical protein